MKKEKFFGYVIIIGESNVGKSTLMNKLLKKKISITSKKKNTTQHQIIGINTYKKYQLIYIDTPGIKKKIKNYYQIILKNVKKEKIIILLVVDKKIWNMKYDSFLKENKRKENKILLIINKIDIIKNKKKLLEYIEFFRKKFDFTHIIPTSAKKKINIDLIKKIIYKYIPKKKHIFQKKYITTHSNNFIASEIIREKLMRFLGDELPYILKIKIKKFEIDKNQNYNIKALIITKKINQKKIIIGKQAKKIKKISFYSRIDMEKFFMKTIHLKILVKNKKNYQS